jgi:hypothetical protein
MKMKKLIMSLLLFGVLPIAAVAQDDDMYFVPSKEVKAKEVYNYGMPSNTYYSGSSRTTDEYNRRMIAAPTDSLGNDIIDFSAVRGVYPDSIAQTEQGEDYQLTRRMTRFDDYTPSQAYWDGYRDGRWSSPWYYNRWYSWYDYDYWYWNDPWYYGSYGYYGGWYSPYYYGYYRPWHYYGYGYYGPRWYASTVRTTPHQGRRTTYRNDNRSFGRTTNTSRTTYDGNRSFGSNRSSSNSSFGSSRSSSGGFGGGGGFSGGGGGARTSSGGRSFGGRK